MSEFCTYTQKFNEMLFKLPVKQLSETDLRYLREIAPQYQFTFQDLRSIVEIATDFKMWNIDSFAKVCTPPKDPMNAKNEKKKILNQLKSTWENLKNTYICYENSNTHKLNRPEKINSLIFRPSEKTQETTVLGKCPVASEKTLCCNLQTLDVVDNCGFECSYCSIQSFFPNNTIFYEDQLVEKMTRLKFAPDKLYHIGTGQSSDSLMWGNKASILDNLTQFAYDHTNIALEFKTKSKNISYFLNRKIPKNIICTWSVNPQTIIDFEEHHTASIEERIMAARKFADKGNLVGFHFHPMIYYKGHEEDYLHLVDKIMSTFSPDEVAMISLGTLTFTKPVIKEIRKKNIYSKILQMPLVKENGKLTYPKETKIKLFSVVYNAFTDWHKRVFFYFCMEDKLYWENVFGYSYKDNDEFESNMKKSYFLKINEISE